MPRPSRCRRVCAEPLFRRFAPQAEEGACPNEAQPVVLAVDEYEVVRIVDLYKRSHEECARQMQVSRTTVTEIYERARFKIADAIVNGRPLVIEGGNYRLCEESSREKAGCHCPGRCRRQLAQACSGQRTSGGNIMKVALPFFDNQVFAHFGKAPAVKIYTIDDNGIAAAEVVPSAGHGHGSMVNLLVRNGVDTVICGGIGGGAVAALAQAGIRLFAGVSGPTDEAVEALIKGTLASAAPEAAEGGCCCGGHGHAHEAEGGCGCHGEEGHAESCGCGGHRHGHGHGEKGGCGCGGHGHGHGEAGGCGCGR